MNARRLIVVLLAPTIGCMQAAYESKDSATRAPEAMISEQAGAMDAGGEGKAPNDGSASESQRKIIYTATVDLVVEDFGDVPKNLTDLVAEFQGRIESSSEEMESGRGVSGYWKVRVPVAKFQEFLTAIRKLGEVSSVALDSQDVGRRYRELDENIKSMTVSRDRLREILADEKRTGKLKDVLDVEERLAKLQASIEIEQAEFRALQDRIAMTTVDVSVRQIRNYVPPEAASFGTLARRSFEQSWAAMKNAGQAVALGAIALAIWLPLILVVLLILRFGWRRVRRKV